MESLEILKITIKKRIFVVPLDFQGNGSVIGSSHMIYFVRDCRALRTINEFPDYDIALEPATIRQGTPKSLRRVSLAAAAPDQLDIRDSDFHKGIAQFAQWLGEVLCEHRQRVVLGLYIETRVFQIGQIQGAAPVEL